MNNDDLESVTRIRQLNDALRMTGMGGAVVITAGVAAMSAAGRDFAMAAVSGFAAFTADNDPHGEHDCARVEVGDTAVMWKIDYYAADMSTHSADPADPLLTRRVMTVMLDGEY